MRDVVERMRSVGAAKVRGRLYDLGAYPGIVLDAGAGEVTGQVLELPHDADALLRLDAYEGFAPDDPARSLFRRVQCRAELDSGRVCECGVYVYNGEVAESRLIAAGVWQPRTVLGLPQQPDEQELEAMTQHRRPVIGVTLGTVDGKPRYELPFDYTTSIERAGGIPLAIPYRTDLSLIPEIVDLFDGMLFTGGNDLDPALYGETYHPRAEPVDPDRQRFELALLAEVERRRTPALGVCLGSQLMNVHRGGSLIQFLPEHARDGAIEHRMAGDDGRRHVIRIEPGTVLGGAIGKGQIVANTRHKQAISRVGRGLRVNATAPDGVVEGVEDPSMPLFLAVQWHPENLSEQPEHLAPFKLLVEKAGRGRVEDRR
jgi:putative glutamine amidotransferase